MANLSWYAGDGSTRLPITASSGLGFYGAGGFGTAVYLSSFQASTYIVDADGVTQGPQVENTKYYSLTQAIVRNIDNPVDLRAIPNDKAALNLRFTHTEAVDVQSCWVTACGRNNVEVPPSGLNVYACELRHTSVLYDTSLVSSSTWTQLSSTGNILHISNSPGPSGVPNNKQTQHDWYLALTIQPTSGGNKYFGLYAEMEYL